MVPGVGSPNDQRPSKRASRGEWLVNVADDEVAPMTTLEVVDALRKGRLSEQALVWRVGMRNWISVLEVPQLRLASSSRPPAPSVAPKAEVVPMAPALPAQAIESAKLDSAADTQSAQYVDSPEHFQSVRDDESEEEDEPVTTLMRESAEPAVHGSLAPTTAEAVAPATARGAWGDLDELLSGERRAEQQQTRRLVLWAALGSAAMAAAFTLFVVRSPTRDEPLPSAPAERPDVGAALPEVPAPSAAPSAEPPASSRPMVHPPTAPRSAGAAHFARRPEHAAPGAPEAVAPPADAAPDAPPVAVVPAAPLEPAAPASAAPPPIPSDESR